MKTRPATLTCVAFTLLCTTLGGNGAVPQSPSSTLTAQTLIDELVLANRMLASREAGVLDASGDVSIRSRIDPKHFYIARAVAPGVVTANDVIEDDLEGNSVSGDRREQYDERFIHSAIYKARPDVAAIVHCHTPELVAFSASTVRLYRRDDVVPVFAIGNVNPRPAGVAGNAVLGRSVADSLAANNALLLRNDGAVVVSPTIYNLVIDAVTLRAAAETQQQLIAMGAKWSGDPVRVAPNAPLAPQPSAPLVLSRNGGGFGGVERAWDYFKQIVGRELTGPHALPRAVQASVLAQATADDRVIDELVNANQIVSYKLLGIVDGLGHLSVRSPNNPAHYFISRNVSAAFVTRADIIENDLDSMAVGGGRSDEFQEAFIHGEIYKARADVMAVLHAHTPEIRTFSLGLVMLRPVINEAAFIRDGLPIHDIRNFDPRELLIRTPFLGRSLAVALADKPGVLLRGHGIALTGSSVPDLIQKAYDLRMNARIQQQALALRGAVTYVDPPKVVRRTTGDRAWQYWKELVTSR